MISFKINIEKKIMLIILAVNLIDNYINRTKSLYLRIWGLHKKDQSHSEF